LPAAQLNVDRTGIKRNASREAIDHGQQRLAVRFAGSPVT
jgi:hypothetical protein